VTPYGLYGLAFFAIVVVPQLVSGGLLDARYSFNAPFAMTSGAAIVVLVPLLAQTVAATEHLLARQFPAWLSRFTVAQTDEFRREVLRYWRGQLLVLGGLAVVTGAAVIVGAPRLGATFPILEDLARHPGLLTACTIGYLCLGVGVFCSQLLFSLSAPMRPLAAAWAGLVALTATSIATAWAGPTVSAVAGLVAGAGVYACVAVVLAHRSFMRADLTYYRTL
jgi:MFS family permease